MIMLTRSSEWIVNPMSVRKGGFHYASTPLPKAASIDIYTLYTFFRLMPETLINSYTEKHIPTTRNNLPYSVLTKTPMCYAGIELVGCK